MVEAMTKRGKILVKKRKELRCGTFRRKIQTMVIDPAITVDTRLVIALLEVHQPGIEPGSVPWQGTILPLDHWCFAAAIIRFILNILLLIWLT
ncbi:hypothetical protein HN51_050326 [Arachis hypogaea]